MMRCCCLIPWLLAALAALLALVAIGVAIANAHATPEIGNPWGNLE